MSYQYLQMGIAAAQGGSMEEAARLLRLAVKSPEVNAQSRAVAYMWLAETTTDTAQKRAYYQQAVESDPANADIRARVDAFLATQFQPPPTPTAPPPPGSLPEAPRSGSTPPPASLPEAPRAGSTPAPYAAQTAANPYTPNPAPPAPAMPNTVSAQMPPAQILAPQTGTVLDYVVSVIGGPNGTGSGFFASQHPIIATTRHVVGGAEQVTIEFSPGRGATGTVIRTYSDYDLALIRIDYAPPSALPASPMPRVPDETALTAVSYGGAMTSGRQRPTTRVMASYWIPTDFSTLPDAGGAPLFDPQNYLVGMITRDTSRSADHFFGVHISLIRQCIDTVLADLQTTKAAYCAQCGSQSRAGGLGYFFCEVCGAVMPAAQGITRYPIPQAEPFYAPANAPRCPHCQAVTGSHNGKCLRCGQPTV